MSQELLTVLGDKGPGRRVTNSEYGRLSSREQEVLRMIAEGIPVARHRGKAVHQRQDGGEPPLQHPSQARPQDDGRPGEIRRTHRSHRHGDLERIRSGAAKLAGPRPRDSGRSPTSNRGIPYFLASGAGIACKSKFNRKRQWRAEKVAESCGPSRSPRSFSGYSFASGRAPFQRPP